MVLVFGMGYMYSKEEEGYISFFWDPNSVLNQQFDSIGYSGHLPMKHNY